MSFRGPSPASKQGCWGHCTLLHQQPLWGHPADNDDGRGWAEINEGPSQRGQWQNPHLWTSPFTGSLKGQGGGRQGE